MDRFRRLLLAALAAAAIPASADTKVHRIGIMSLGTPANSGPIEVLKSSLRDLGYREGVNVSYTVLWAEGNPGRFQALAGELAAMKPDVIVTGTTPAVQAVMRVTSTIPVVMLAAADPVGNKLVASLSRPGGNVTGISFVSLDTGAKSLEMIAALVPKLSRVAILVPPGNAVYPNFLRQAQSAAAPRGIRVAGIDATSNPGDIERAFASIAKEGHEAVIVLSDAGYFFQRRAIVAAAGRHRIPVMYSLREFVEEGGLVSYGAALATQYKVAAPYVDKILKGARPADLPVQQAGELELNINLRTARSLGLEVPREIVLRADKVFE